MGGGSGAGEVSLGCHRTGCVLRDESNTFVFRRAYNRVSSKKGVFMKLNFAVFLLTGFLLTVFLFTGAAHAQQLTGTITGAVTDTSGAAVGGVQVRLSSAQTGLSRVSSQNRAAASASSFCSRASIRCKRR